MAGGDTRDRVIAAIYESVIRPELYDAFMDAWDTHIEAALAARDVAISDTPPDAIEIDPELSAHFVRAYEILEQIGRRSEPQKPLDRIATSAGFALVLDLNGRVLAASPVAKEMLGAALDLAALQAELSAPSTEVLAHLIRAGQEGEPDAAPVVLATALPPRHLMARLEPGLISGAPAVVVEAMEYQWSASVEAMLVASFGLSRAEVEIVRQLLAGRSLRQIAEHSGRSEHTVRNQAKAVLAKTGAPGQVDLIRLIVFLINQLNAEARNAAVATLPEELLTTGGGRTTQVFRLDARGSRAVIYIHGMIDGMAPLTCLRDAFRRRRLSVIAPVRPGFGRTTAVPRYEQAIDIHAEDVARVIDHYGLVRPVILTQLGGGLYGHALARRLGRRVAGLVAVSGPVPFTRLKDFTDMAARQRVVAYTARFAPALLPTVLRAGIAQVDGKGVEEFLSALFKPGTQENDMIQRLDLAPVLYAGFRFSVEQGPAGFATDSHFIVRDWSREIDARQAPTICINGAHDPVVSAQRVVACMAGRPNVEVRVLPEAGQLALYEQPEAVFEAIDDIFAMAETQSGK